MFTVVFYGLKIFGSKTAQFSETPPIHPNPVSVHLVPRGKSAGAEENSAERVPKPSRSPRASSTKLEFPIAKPVPGKPGYVFSPFDTSGRYIDVSGYTSGSKVKDPWNDKIFIVP